MDLPGDHENGYDSGYHCQTWPDPGLMICMSGLTLNLPCHHKLLGTTGGLMPQRCKALVCPEKVEVLPLSDLPSAPSVRKICQMEQNIVILTSLCT